MTYCSELFGLEGKVAVVIGGSGALGGSMALALGRAGAKVAVGFRSRADDAQSHALRIEREGGSAFALKADGASQADLEETLATVLGTWGRVDVLVNAPGVNSPKPFFEIPESEWASILDTNLRGVFYACRVFGKQMIDQKQGGSIINISSVSSEVPLSRVFTYSISKAGVNNLTRFLAREWAPYKIRVNAIMPGFFPAEQNRKILTEERVASIMGHTPMKRFGKPSELIAATLYLASEKASSFVTGSIVRVDGGFGAMTI